jgi:hypothetical protein
VAGPVKRGAMGQTLYDTCACPYDLESCSSAPKICRARRERGGRARPEPHDRTTRYDEGPVAAPSRRFSFCLSSRARVLIPVLTPHRLRVLGPEHGKFCIVLLNTQCEEVPMKLGATSISFRPKVFSDATSVVDGIFSAHRVCTTRINRCSRLLRARGVAEGRKAARQHSWSGHTGRNHDDDECQLVR